MSENISEDLVGPRERKPGERIDRCRHGNRYSACNGTYLLVLLVCLFVELSHSGGASVENLERTNKEEGDIQPFFILVTVGTKIERHCIARERIRKEKTNLN